MPKSIAPATTAALLVFAVVLDAQTIREVAGADPAAIQPMVDMFRADLGPQNPNDPGSNGTGRREINWDGVPVTLEASLAAPGILPGDFFNDASAGRARGVILSTPDDLFQVSAATTDPAAQAKLAAIEFGNINTSYPAQFVAFSAERLFTPLTSNITEVRFFVPGTGVPALARGFGAVFVDVDRLGSARIEYYDANNNLLLSRAIPPANAGLSFLGVSYAAPVIARVVVVSGSDAIGPDDVSTNPDGPDIVVLDDFIFGEPVPFPAISIDDVAVTEGNEGVTPVEFTITLSAPSTQEITVSYSTVDSVATVVDGDFEPVAGSLTFPPGEITRTVTVNVVGDNRFEQNETFDLLLSNAVGASIADIEGVAAIANDDGVPIFSIDDPMVTETDQGTIARFLLSLSNPTFRTVTVNYRTVSGTAQQDVDYRGQSGTLTFGPGTTRQNIDVLVVGDLIDETHETFSLQLDTPANAELPDTFGVATIIDDDEPGDNGGGGGTGAPLCAAGVGLPGLAIMLGLGLQLGSVRRRT